jgi:heat shock protein HtpX
MARRILLFVLTNILVIITISIVLNILGVGNYLTAEGIDYSALMVFCLVWGMVGALISLAMSRFMAKMLMRVALIDPQAQSEYQWLVNMVYDLAKRAGLPRMPEVGVYNSPDVNAFATGPTKSRSLVAVSTGLLGCMSRQEIEGVIGHEISHVANGDMVTMTLLQGVINAFVMFFARIIAYAVSQSVKEDMRGIVNFITVIVLQILLGFLGMMVTGWFSRAREFRADRGSAGLTGRESMTAALEKLQRLEGRIELPAQQHASFASLQISDNRKRGMMSLFATHPPLAERIEALKHNAQ